MAITNSAEPLCEFAFQGEESARFARFAQACSDSGIGEVLVRGEGREPLTSRPITISGVLTQCQLDGYIRFITVEEGETGISHNLGGSNSTRSVASRTVTFSLTSEQRKKLKSWAVSAGVFVPLVNTTGVRNAAAYRLCEEALKTQDPQSIRGVLDLFSCEDPKVRAEAALTVRGVANAIKTNRKLHQVTEKALISLGRQESDRDTLVAALEDLGYLGEEDSKDFLSQIISAPSSDQACWAAVIALSRLGGDADVWRPLIAALENPQEWVRRAALLALARRANAANQADFEPVFAANLLSDDDLLRRYACLGLSRFRKLAEDTWHSLITILSDEAVPFGTKGYAALTISGAYPGTTPELRDTIVTLLGTMPGKDDLASIEIDSVWSLEFLGELASISGLPQVSARFYRALSYLFSDWRADYYLAICAYELGEAEAGRADGEDAITKFSEAVKHLSFPTEGLLDDAVVTIAFRREVVEARRRLQALVVSWRDTTDAGRLERLSLDAKSIEEQYRHYTDADALGGRERQLVQREIEYLKTTALFMQLLSVLLQLDARIRALTISDSDQQAILMLVSNAEELIGEISTRLDSVFSLPLETLRNKIKDYLGHFGEALSTELPFVEKLKPLRNYMRRMCAAFWSSSWPMPGRACPVYGLGRASIAIRPGAYKGKGTFNDPIIFSAETPVVLPLFVRILDMATGGNAELVISYSIAGEFPRQIPVHAVEDEFPIPIDLRAYVDSGELAVDVRAIFKARDCVQQADRNVYHVRTKPWS